MILFLTGHRKVEGAYYRKDNEDWQWVEARLHDVYMEHLRRYRKELEVVSGMAAGFDQLGARVALELGIPVTPAIPFVGQEKKWPAWAQTEYKKLLKRCLPPKVVCDPGYAPWKMDARNRWMVDVGDKGVACWDGSLGGTNNCIQYALSQSKTLIRLDPAEWTRGELT